MNADAPILIAYDGSDTARRAVHDAAELFGSRQALVMTVWEPGLALGVGAMPGDPMSLGPPVDPVDPFIAAREVDDASRTHADRVAEEGAELAKSLGLRAEAMSVADARKASDAIVELARGYERVHRIHRGPQAHGVPWHRADPECKTRLPHRHHQCLT